MLQVRLKKTIQNDLPRPSQQQPAPLGVGFIEALLLYIGAQ